MHCSNCHGGRVGAGRRRTAGFTFFELVISMTVVSALTAMAVPYVNTEIQGYRMRSAVNMLSSELSAARMESVAQADPYQVAISGTNLQLNVENMSAGTFSMASKTGAFCLPEHLSFGFGSLATGAGDGAEQEGSNGSMTPVQSSTITFNTMGIPVGTSGTPVSQNAFYVTDGENYGAVTVSLSGRILRWLWNGSAWVEV